MLGHADLGQEHSRSSTCAFCAARLSTARNFSHVQRRFLHSSQAAGRPPAAEAALREEKNEMPLTRAAEPSWGGGSAATWGRASTAKTTDIPAWPAWSQSSVNGDRNQVNKGEDSSSRAVAKDADILPHELRARQLLAASQAAQKRQVSIPTGPGPESSRAGRHEPRVGQDRFRIRRQDRQAIAREALARKEARDEQTRKLAAEGGEPPRIGRPQGVIKHILGDVEVPSMSPLAEASQQPLRWTQLKRRVEAALDSTDAPAPKVISSQPQSRKEDFAVARARREEESKSRRYTPVGARSIMLGSEGSQDQRPWSSPYQPPEGKYSTQYGSLNKLPSIADAPSRSQATASTQSMVSWGRSQPLDTKPKFPRRQSSAEDVSVDSHPHFRILRTAPRNIDTEAMSRRAVTVAPETRRNEPNVDRGQQRSKEEHDEKRAREEREEGARNVPARFASAKPSYKNEPKGKARDKTKRREQFLDRDEDNEENLEKARLRQEAKAQRKLEKAAKKAAEPTPILLPEYITVANLAMALKVRVETFIEKLLELGYEETTTDHILDAEDSGLIAMEYNFEAIIDRSESEDIKAREPAADPSSLPPRPPVVTIMGHVDHGKTTLLDWLRKSSVAATEHGGITQHIGAFSVPMPSGKIITFLDTPGHAAFLSMRQRGANVTDIVILVVAADDSVKPQTIEAINHAKKAKVPIIVAINKIDKDEANIDRVKQDLARHGVDVEDFGGDTQVVCVSGKTGQGMGELEEAAVALSELLDMRAETDGPAEGWVLEASIKSMGKVATVLVRRGTMRAGDVIVAGNTWARIRCLRNEAGVEIESAGPGTPVEIDGWREQPLAGDEVLQAPGESKAKSVVEYRLENEERDKMAQDMEAINESRKSEQEKREREKEETRLVAEAEASNQEYVPESGEEKVKGPKEVYFIVKGDVSGSVEAVIESISLLGNKEVQPHILRAGVGQLSEFDIEHAAAAKGHLINFNTPLEPHISAMAEKNKVIIIDQNIIYRLVDEVRAELSKHLPPLITHKVLGEAEIAQIFSITVKGRQHKNIAGCKIKNGTIFRNSKVRVHRNGEKVFDGKSLAAFYNSC